MDVQEPESVSLEELLQGLEELDPQVEDGFLDVFGWAKVWKVGIRVAGRSVSKLVKAGRMVVRKVRTDTITGGYYWKPVYGIVKQNRDESEVCGGEVQEGRD